MGREHPKKKALGGAALPARIGRLATAVSNIPVRELLDSAAGQDVKALRAALRISQAAMGVHRFEDALEVIAEQSLLALIRK